MYNLSQTRRKFLKTILKGAGALWAYLPLAGYLNASPATIEPRQRKPNPYVTGDGHPKLVCVTGDNCNLMLQTGLTAIGGLGLLIDDNQPTLIKPNFVYTEIYPTTSDINMIIPIIRSIQAVSDGAITVGDVGGINARQVYDFLGIEGPITDAGANLKIYEDTYDVRRSDWPPEMPDFKVWADIYDTPILINLCALKRHYAAYMTCAIKHHVGAVAGPDRQQTRGYLHGFDDRSFEFLTTIAEMAGLVNPELTIVDARQVMAINGPLRSYGGEIRDCGKLIICGDPVAADAYCARLLAQYDETFNADWVTPTLQRAEALGMGTANLDDVEIIELEQISIDDFSDSARPEHIELYQNYPNPFNATTTISFNLPERSSVRIDIYDLLGRKAVTLADRMFEAGMHNIAFNANGLSSGMYYYNLITDKHNMRKAMVLIK
jgi:uncharacterized protein (DUF362 family)